jgi:thermitase
MYFYAPLLGVEADIFVGGGRVKHLSIFVLFFVIISLVLVPLCSAGASNANQDNSAGFQPVTSEYILHFKPGVSPGRMQQIYEALGNPSETEIPQINAGIVRLPLTDENVAALYSQYPEIELIEPDHIVQAMEVPDDIKFDQQWGLSKIEASKAWDLTQGSPSVKIAILDSGIDSDHTDLAGKVVVEKNFSDSPTTDDKYGHGTHAAGLAAALTGNAIGVAGLGYKTSLMNVKVLGDSGTGSYSWIIQGIIWAADKRGRCNQFEHLR